MKKISLVEWIIFALMAAFVAAMFAGCATSTTVYNGAGKRLLCVQSNAAAVKYRGADGTTLEMVGVDNATTTLAAGKAAGDRINAVAGAVTALGATTLLK